MVTDSSEIITITLNGLTVSGSPGMTILELARESGIEIPTLCSDPHLSPIGACRICIVQDERNGNVFASCVTPISPGMEINTHTETVIAHRKNIIELMLASHPDTCMVCDKGNRCQLRQIASDIGIGLTRLYKTPQLSTIQEINPYLERDLTKCILCGKCIRACQEMVVEGAIDYYQRGFAAKPATFNDLPLENSECTFCGTCVSLCPTGALSEKYKTYRSSAGTAVDTMCPFCACGCLLNVEIKDNSIVRVKPGSGESVNNGTACKWGVYHLDFIHSHDRLTRPLIKMEDHMEESSWDSALNLISDRFNKIKREYGSKSIAISGSPNCTNEDNYVLQRFARNVIGTNNIDSLCHYPAFSSSSPDEIIISGDMIRIRDIDNADLIMVMNANPENTAPMVSYAIKRAARFKKTKLITIYPVETKLTEFSSIWLHPEIGTEIALLNGLIKGIVATGNGVKNLNNTFSNYAEFIDLLGSYTPSSVEKITGVPSEQLTEASRLISWSKHPVFIFDVDLAQNGNSTKYIRAIENLLLIINSINGQLARRIILQPCSNSLGMKDMGISPHFLPGYQSMTDPNIIKKFNTAWDAILPTEGGKGFIEILADVAANKGSLKAMYIVGSNRLLSQPVDINIEQLFTSLDFLVVQDLFLTETAKMADVILPAASFAEKTGTFTNLEGRIQKVNKIYDPVGESLPDWEIFVRLSQKLGNSMPYRSPNEIMEEIDKLIPLYQGYSTIAKPQNRNIDTANRRNEIILKKRSESSELPIIEYESENMSRYNYPSNIIDIQNLEYFGTGTRTSRSSRFINKKADELIIDSSHK